MSKFQLNNRYKKKQYAWKKRQNLPAERVGVEAGVPTESLTVIGRKVKSCPVTVIVPAYNEADCIADMVNSLLEQSLMPEAIIVIDDGSTDKTAEICRSLGVMVITPPENTGSKAGAQNYALSHIKTEYTLALDAVQL